MSKVAVSNCSLQCISHLVYGDTIIHFGILQLESTEKGQVLSGLDNLAEWWYSDGGRLRPGLILITHEAVKRENDAFRPLLSFSILKDFLLFSKWEEITGSLSAAAAAVAASTVSSDEIWWHMFHLQG